MNTKPMSNTGHYKAGFHTNYQRPREADSKQEQANLALCESLLRNIFSDYRGPAAIRLWDRRTVIGKDNADAALVFKKQYPLRRVILEQ